VNATTLAEPPAHTGQAAPASLPHGHIETPISELDVRPLGGFAPEPTHRALEDFVFLTDVENECEHGAVPLDAIKGRASCDCHAAYVRRRKPTPPLLEVLKPRPRAETPVKRKEPVLHTTPPAPDPAYPKTPTPVQPCDRPDLDELPEFLAGMVREIDSEIARLTAARATILEAARV
jgi:hypothetical protein